MLVRKLTEFLCMCWEDGCLPQDLKDARMVLLYKGKGDKSSCDNYRGISLLSIAGKILCKVILNRLNTHLLDEIVPESQCDFRKNRGTVDMIFCARQIQEKCKEQNKDLYILFVDLTLALIRELLYADDCAIVAHSEHDLQQLADSLSIATKRSGLTISIKKTEVLFQRARGSTASTPKIKIDGKILNCVDSFTYLGSSLSSSNSLDKEISTRIAKANASYGRLQKRVLCDRGLSIETKCAVYKAAVLSALLYGCESWTLYRRHTKLLDPFHQRCLRRIMNIKWFNKVTNVKVLQKAKTQSIDTQLTLSQLRWSGHLVRMSDDKLPKQLLYSELSEGQRLRGRPTLRFKDSLKKSLQNCRIVTAHWETTASNRRLWKQLTRKGAAAYEQAKRRAHAEKRAATDAGTESRGSSIPCHVCGRICASAFGLRSHLRVQRWTPDLGAWLDIIVYDSRPYIHTLIYYHCIMLIFPMTLHCYSANSLFFCMHVIIIVSRIIYSPSDRDALTEDRGV